MNLLRRYIAVSPMTLLVVGPCALGQPRSQTFHIGFLSPTSAAANQPRLESLRAGLRAEGYEEGRNMTIHLAFAKNQFSRLPGLARDLERSGVKLIIAVNTPAALAAVATVGSMPIVIASVGDPVGVGLVRDLARPGGNLTGTTNIAGDLTFKRMQLLKEAVPAAQRIAVLTNPDDPVSQLQERHILNVGPLLGIDLKFFPIRSPAELEAVMQTITDWRAEAVFRVAEPVLSSVGDALARSLLARRLPGMLINAREVRGGALMSYFSVEDDQYRMVAQYVGKILKGAKPGDLPIAQPTTFELAINLNTARTLGLSMPQSLLLRANEVIQ